VLNTLTWRIIPVSKYSKNNVKAMKRPFGRGTTLLRGLIYLVINHLLTGMILQMPSMKLYNIAPQNRQGPNPGKDCLPNPQFSGVNSLLVSGRNYDIPL